MNESGVKRIGIKGKAFKIIKAKGVYKHLVKKRLFNKKSYNEEWRWFEGNKKVNS